MAKIKITTGKHVHSSEFPTPSNHELPNSGAQDLPISQLQELLTQETFVYIRQLSAFLARATADTRLQPTHISVYMSLFQQWAMGQFINPVIISRAQVQGISKTKAKSTYLRNLRQLHAFGYIIYKPSFKPSASTEVELINLQQLLSQHQKINPIPVDEKYRLEQMVNKRLRAALLPTTESTPTQSCFQNQQNQNNLNTPETAAHQTCCIPKLQEVIFYFIYLDKPLAEAHKFFNYYTANGWLLNGWAPVVDWQAALRHWVLTME